MGLADSDFWNEDLTENIVNRGALVGDRLIFLVHRIRFLEWKFARKPRKSWGGGGWATQIFGSPTQILGMEICLKTLQIVGRR